MRTKITASELVTAATKVGLAIQHDCGGYRVVQETDSGGWTYVFPDGGTCPTESKRACMGFLVGAAWSERCLLGQLRGNEHQLMKGR